MCEHLHVRQGRLRRGIICMHALTHKQCHRRIGWRPRHGRPVPGTHQLDARPALNGILHAQAAQFFSSYTHKQMAVRYVRSAWPGMASTTRDWHASVQDTGKATASCNSVIPLINGMQMRLTSTGPAIVMRTYGHRLACAHAIQFTFSDSV